MMCFYGRRYSGVLLCMYVGTVVCFYIGTMVCFYVGTVVCFYGRTCNICAGLIRKHRKTSQRYSLAGPQN